MCRIYKYGLLPTARKHFGHDPTPWQLQEDNDPKHRSKLAPSWKEEKKIENIDWPSMSSDIAPIENMWQIFKMKLRKKKVYNLSIFGLGNKTRMEGTTKGLILKSDT